MTDGQIAFEAYVADCADTCVFGDELQTWAEQDPDVQRHWEAAGRAVRQAQALLQRIASAAEWSASPSASALARFAGTSPRNRPGRSGNGPGHQCADAASC